MEGISGSGFGCPSAGVFWFFIFAYLQPSLFSFAKSALTVFLAFEKTPGQSETEGTWWFTHGGRRFARVVERWVRSVVIVPLLNNNFPFVLLYFTKWNHGRPGWIRVRSLVRVCRLVLV